jgi:hypothetical protein
MILIAAAAAAAVAAAAVAAAAEMQTIRGIHEDASAQRVQFS